MFSRRHFGLINGNQEERQLLVEEQKLCRARARKMFLENQRRRKALEERRKQWDDDEQRKRENALQQRKQKIQEATERFQRAHRPPSPRRRQFSKKDVLSLEDALNHIQGTLGSDTHQSSFAPISRSHTPSPKTTPWPNDSSPQEDCINSESIIKDSLESEEPKNATLSPAFLLDKDKCLSDFKKHFQQPDYPTETLMDEALTQSRKLHELKLKQQIAAELLKKKNGVRYTSWVIARNEKASNIDSTDHCNVKSTKNSTPINTEPDTSSLKQESVLDLKQPKANDDRQVKHPPATEILLPTKNGNSTDYLFGASKPNVVLNNCTMDYTCQEGALEQAGKNNLCVSSRKELSVAINNLNKTADADDKAKEKKINTELIHHTCLNTNQPNSFKCLKCCEKEELLSPVSLETTPRICGVQFIKGIIKKQSKYMTGDAASVCTSGQQQTLIKQVALVIRDSFELTRAKNRNLLINTAVKKKLRWFDEVHVDSEDKGQNIIKQICSKSSSLLHSENNSEDHQLSILGASKTGPSMTHAVPNGYHFTRRAWADVGVQVSLPQQHGDEVKVQQRNNKSSGLKASTKERAEAAPVSSRTRKGIHIRPQSATEVSQIARAHGRQLRPHPPPPRTHAIEEQKGLVTTAPYGPDHAKVSRPTEEHGLQQEGSETRYPGYTNKYRTDHDLLLMPHPPSYTCTNPESYTKSKPGSSHHDTRAGMRHVEKGSYLNRTPTEAEISELCLEVRTALTMKDAQTAWRQQVVDSAHSGWKNSATLGIRKQPYSAQPTNQQPDTDKQFSFPSAFSDGDSLRFGHLSKDEIQTDGHQSWVGIKDPQRHQALHQRHQQGITTISMEEERILQSLDRLNHQLQYVQEQHPGGSRGHNGFRNPYTTDLNSTSPQKLQPAAYQSQKRV